MDKWINKWVNKDDNDCSENENIHGIFVGKVLLLTQEWEIAFLCDFCNHQMSTLPDLLRHTLTEHIEDVPEDKLQEFCAIEEVGCVNGDSEILVEETLDDTTIEERLEDEDEEIQEADEEHNKSHAEEKKFICKICGTKFKFIYQFKNHLKTHGVKPFNCKDCGASFAQNSKLKVHKLRHLGIKPHSCTICSKSFTTSTDLKRHMGIHNGQHPYKCNLCDMTFRLSSKLSSHRRLEHLNKKPDFYTCPYCEKTFDLLRKQLEHVKTHSTERPHKCSECEATFKLRKGLRQHELIHSEVKKFCCEFCGKRFAQHAGVAAHVKTIHKTDSRPYKCDECDASFKIRKGLDQHVLIHSEVKKYCCEFCGKRFAQQAGFATHVKTIHKNDVLSKNKSKHSQMSNSKLI